MVVSFVNDRRRNIKLPLGFHVDAYLVGHLHLLMGTVLFVTLCQWLGHAGLRGYS
jgi:hypothetical protein